MGIAKDLTISFLFLFAISVSLMVPLLILSLLRKKYLEERNAVTLSHDEIDSDNKCIVEKYGFHLHRLFNDFHCLLEDDKCITNKNVITFYSLIYLIQFF